MYDDGLGGSFARFNIDLYYCGGGCSLADNCGEIIARLCEVRDTHSNQSIASSSFVMLTRRADNVVFPVEFLALDLDEPSVGSGGD